MRPNRELDDVGSSDFDARFRELYPRSVALGVRMLGNRSAAEDIASEAMARALLRWDKLDHDRVAGWVLKVTANLAIDLMRRKGRTLEPGVIDLEDSTTLRLALADALYDLDRSRPALARFAPIRPRRVVECGTPEQVATALRAGGELAIRSGGHCFAGRSSTSGTLIDVGPLDHVRLEGERATIGAGARLGAIYDALAEHGRTIVAGCGPTVGIAGLTLGGGIGVLGRLYGLTCDRLVSAQVVLADGRIVHTDDHPDLLWALKGAGGGRFGVVTELTFETIPAPRTTVFDVVVPRTAAVVADWQAWAPFAPDELAASLLVLDDHAHVFGAYAGPREEATRLLERLDGDGTLEELEFRAAKQWLADNGPDDGRERPFSRSGFFTQPIAPPLDCKLDFMPLGGAFNRVAPDATAYPHRDALFCLHVEAAEEGTVDRIMDALPSVGVYPNFPEPGRPVWDPAYHRGNRERLLALRDAYDPDGLLSPPP